MRGSERVLGARQCVDDACACYEGFGGADCGKSTLGCPTNCLGHGRCLDGLCECYAGFGGADCGLVTGTCPLNCTGHGMCHNGRCVCLPGFWEGDACDEEVYRCPVELNNCTGRGECGPVDWEDERSDWACTCDAGFCGRACDRVCGDCPQNCSGHGLCRDGACGCDEGFGGAACDRVAPIATCPNNCTGNGLCAKGNGSAFRCVCQDCYGGADCAKASVFCPGNCSGRGQCGCDGRCNCWPGFDGAACEVDRPTCAAARFCSGNGACSANGTCRCDPGYAGAACDLACDTGGVGAVGCGAPRRGRCVESPAGSGNASCACKPEFDGAGCHLNTTSGLFDEYVAGWNPIGTVVLSVAALVVLMFGGTLAYNYSQGKRGVNAMPGVSDLRTKIKGDGGKPQPGGGGG